MTDVEVIHKARKHRWPKDGDEGFKHTLAHESPDGCEHFERVCKLCGMTRITIIPPRPDYAWHEWRTAKGGVFQCEATPPCKGSP